MSASEGNDNDDAMVVATAMACVYKGAMGVVLIGDGALACPALP